ncbi:MAG: TIGR00341 family protein [Anaerolineae bacterium]|nr:TIGR00341 family protein [Anaerolineae bacterium]
MALRLLQVIFPVEHKDEVEQLLHEQDCLHTWTAVLDEDLASSSILLMTEKTETVTDAIGDRFPDQEKFRIILSPVEATIPPLEEPEDESQDDTEADSEADTQQQFGRVSREELYNDVADGARLTINYLLMVFLSTVVAAIGLLRNDVAVIIGAMVIAPLIKPNMAMALAATLGDLKLLGHALRTNGVGIALIVVLSVAMGIMIEIDPEAEQIVSRTDVGLENIGLALAAGSAGALSITMGVSTALIGVMVAVALLPPLVAAGLLAGKGLSVLALNALFLFLINTISVNLTGIATFWFKGIRPRRWWEAEQARRAMRIAVTVWISLLVLAVVIIFFLK